MSVSELVGRADELASLVGLLGRGGVALLAGEPGVGKTALARSFADAAAARGGIALWGAAYEEWSPPYGPWAQALPPLLGDAEPGPTDAVLGAIVPEFTDAEPPALGSREEKLRLHNAVARLLAGADRAVAVVLDDLHWADGASLELLLAVARSVSPGVAVVATMRGHDLGDPAARCVAELMRERLAQRVEVRPLDADECAVLLERLDVDPSLAAGIYEQSQGNPFFIEELARHALEEEYDGSSAPATVRIAVRARVSRLSPDAGRVLGLAAVFTRPFTFAALHALADLPEDVLLDALDEALAGELLRIASAATESYEFTHALVRQSLYEELNPSRRARLHRRVAQALEGLDGDRERAAELAAQYHQSSSLPGAARGVQFALDAAADARRRYAVSEAVRMLRIARDLGAELEPARRVDILCRLALSEAEALELDAAQATGAQALAALEQASVGSDVTVDFLWSLARALRDAGAQESDIRPLVEHGLELVGDLRDIRWARLQLILRPAVPIAAGRIPAERWLGYNPEAVRIARTFGDEHDYAATLELMDWRDRDEVDALLERSRSWREPAARIHALSIAARTLLYSLGAFRDARAVSEELLDESERVGSVPGAAYALEQIADVGIALGEFETAREHLDRARATARTLGPAHRLHFIIGLVEKRFVGYLGGDWQALATEFERAATDPHSPWPWITIQAAAHAALAYAHADDRDRATRLLDELVPLLETLEPTTLNVNAMVVLGGCAVWRLGDAERAEPFARLALALVEAGVGDYVLGSNELTLARMAALRGEAEEASAWFARCRENLREDGRRPLAAIAVVDEAEAAIRAGAPPPRGDLSAAAELLTSLGMSGWAKRAQSLLEQSAEARPAQLTSREVEVLRLLAEGRTNREIADLLVLSVHTIERHLANVYRKIGARNRADATAFALRNL